MTQHQVNTSPLVTPGQPRERVQARLPDGRIFEAPPGTALAAVLAVARRPAEAPVMAAVMNARLRELTTPLTADSDVAPVTMGEPDGMRIYRRSLSFLLVTAAGEVFPDAEVLVSHSTWTGGYYCEVRGRPPFTQAELDQIKAGMRQIVAADAPFSKGAVSLAEAAAIFQAEREEDKARLIAYRRKEPLMLYNLRGHRDYFQGYMVPSAGYLPWFNLHAFPPGFILQFPHQDSPTELLPVKPYPKLFAVFKEAGEWLDRLGIRNVGALNDAIAAGRLREISLVAEAFHEARIARIAADIAAQRERVKVVLIAGPSSSGKTTFAKRLVVQLLANGLRPFPVGLDDYFVDREQTPRGPDGKFDYESLLAINIPRFNDDLRNLIAGKPTTLLHYNFLTGKSEVGPTVTLTSDNLIILEGIHGLNPALVPHLPPEWLYRIYVSALTQLNLDRHNRVSTTDSRLFRRIVRDANTRGYSATQTLQRWESVKRGEKQNIFPFQENNDAMFNSALVHELAVLRPQVEPLLLQVRPDTPEHLEANRLLSFLQWFLPAPADHVPSNSILREFVGGSILEPFALWPLPPA